MKRQASGFSHVLQPSHAGSRRPFRTREATFRSRVRLPGRCVDIQRKRNSEISAIGTQISRTAIPFSVRYK